MSGLYPPDRGDYKVSYTTLLSLFNRGMYAKNCLEIGIAESQLLLDNPSFDRIAVLRSHLSTLEKEQERVQRLIDSVKETILTQERKEIMSDEKKFEVFKQKILEGHGETYEAESRSKYGDAEVNSMLARFKGTTQEQYAELEHLEQEILEKLYAAVTAGADPAGEKGKEIAELHRRWLTAAGGKHDVLRHRGVAELYVQDKRFTAYYDKKQAGCARFLRDAVLAWV